MPVKPVIFQQVKLVPKKDILFISIAFYNPEKSTYFLLPLIPLFLYISVIIRLLQEDARLLIVKYESTSFI